MNGLLSLRKHLQGQHDQQRHAGKGMKLPKTINPTELAKMRGYDKHPRIVESVSDIPGKNLYRGSKHVDKLLHGDYHISDTLQNYGTGTYFSDELNVARGYTRQQGDYIIAKLDPNAKVVTHHDMLEKQQEYRLLGKIGDKSYKLMQRANTAMLSQNYEEHDRLKGLAKKHASNDARLEYIANDIGMLAIYLGYDAMAAPQGETVVYNRGRLIIEELP